MEIRDMTFADGELTLTLSGRLDSLSAPLFESDILPRLEKVDSLVLNLSELSFVASAGLRVLLTIQKKMSEKQGLHLKNVRPEIMEVFEMTGFNTVLHFI
ncbi:MAG: STAS domain-containing protein [Thermoguttaceae bacterium]